MKQAVIIQPLIENNRIQLGISYIERALKDVGYEFPVSQKNLEMITGNWKALRFMWEIEKNLHI